MMPTLMPAISTPLTLPLAARARLSEKQPAWLRDCLTAVQEDYLSVRFAVPVGPPERRELLTHEADACCEMLVDAWLDALCPLPVFFTSAGKEARN